MSLPFVKRRIHAVTTVSAVSALAMSFFLGAMLANVFSPPEHILPHDPDPSGMLHTNIQTQTVTRMEPMKENLAYAWKSGRETCRQWISSQKMASSYIDFYMIGAQKSATSELCMRLGHLKVWRKGMEKEWHFFEKLEEPGMKFRTALHMPYTPAELQNLRSEHYKSGFPGSENGEVPVIDDANVNNRSVVYDATVEYMLSDRVAFLAHALTPHAKIVMTIREPLDRALSQYNMMTRLYNTARREKGESDVAASARQFHEIIVREISKLKTCGYDAETGNVDRATSELLKCMYADGKFDFEDLLYVTRGLYHMHILAWRNYFPDHRMMFISFADIASGERKTMNEFTDFLCVRRFGEDLLERYKERGSSVSFGRQAAEKGLNRMGFESYEGKDKYLVEVLPETRAVVDEFYKGANRRLEALLGRKMF